MKNNPIIETPIFICECNSFEHQVKFIYDMEDSCIYLYVHLTKDKFWARIKKGIKYILGHSSRFGEWEEFIFQQKDEESLRKFLNGIKQEKDGDELP